ncbi:MAG: LamG-like jellyroll fold domain-containing protein [Planctomycetota bacterium]
MSKKLLYLAPVVLSLTLLFANTASADLIAHWPLDGHYIDATGNGHDGTPLGDPEFVIDGMRGTVLEVDGGDDRVIIDDTPDLNYGTDESLTMTVWVLYDPSLAPAGWKCILGKGRTDTGGNTDYLEEVYAFYVSGEGNWHVNAGGLWGDTIAAAPGEWHHLAFVQNADEDQCFFYIDLQEVMSGGAESCSTPGRPFFIGAGGTDLASTFEAFGGRISDIRIYNEALMGDTLAATTVPLTPKLADIPSPANEATDVPLDDIALSWMPGEFAKTHDVYFGTSFDDVNDATKGSPEYKTTKLLGDESYVPGSLELGTTYYWRIDEVNAPPNQSTVFKGEVWQFTTEPLGYPITDITATASSFAAGQGPENTVNGSGLDADDQHSITANDMWLPV